MYNEYFKTKKDITDIKIALISDIHYAPNYNNKILDKIYNEIKDNKPNYICITGDILDNALYTNTKDLIKWLTNLSSISPTIMVLGNHDLKKRVKHHWEYEEEHLKQDLKGINNLYLLEDNYYQDGNITFYGFNPSFIHYQVEYETYESFEKEMAKTHLNFNKNNYNIFLIHTPINIYKYIEKNKIQDIDLVLSGHTHNGCIPFCITHLFNHIFKTTRSLISPNKKFFRKYTQGRVYGKQEGYIYEGLIKFGRAAKPLNKLNYFYRKHVMFINIKKDS